MELLSYNRPPLIAGNDKLENYLSTPYAPLLIAHNFAVPQIHACNSSKYAEDVVRLVHFYVLGFVSTGMSFGLPVRVYNVTTSTAIGHPPVISKVSPGCFIF